jgi:hypothetical protein
MKSFPFISVVLSWVFFVPVAFLNGVIRDKVYRPLGGELRAHQDETEILLGAFETAL